MKQGKLCLQCTDDISGKLGTFLAEIGPGSRAISPVYPDFISLRVWLTINAWEHVPYSEEYPTGLYQKEEPVVLVNSPEAAKLVTVTGWQSRNGYFYGDNEGAARWNGATHTTCKVCGKVISKRRGLCHECVEKLYEEKHVALPRAEWDGKAMLYSGMRDNYYASPDDAKDALEEGETLADLRLVICTPTYVRQLTEDDFANDLPEDGRLPDAVKQAMDAFNAAVSGIVLSWFPEGFALKTE